MLKWIGLLALPMLLGGCPPGQTRMIATAVPEPLVCSVWRPITYASKHDTAQTITEVRSSNAKRAEYCAAVKPAN